MITISHVIDPVVESALKYSTAPRPLVPTCRDPGGVEVDVKVAPLVADLEGSCKVGGFLTTAAIMFCTFCLCTHAQIEELDISSWILRNGNDVRAEAALWLSTVTKSGREAQARETGVRWTPLHRLPYWDPVKHVILGFMHNWLEGILQHHLRILWRIGVPEEVKKAVVELEKDEQWSQADSQESAEELEGLQEEAEEALQQADVAAHAMRDSPSPTRLTASDATPTQDNTQPNPYPFMDIEDGDDETIDSDSDFVPLDLETFTFSDTELAAIRDCIANISLPTWIG